MNYNIFIIIVFIILLFYRLFYYLLTSKRKVITVKKKFVINKHHNSILKIFDNDKIEYLLDEDIILSESKCKKMWELITEGETYDIKYYGLNIPFLAISYRIIEINDLKN